MEKVTYFKDISALLVIDPYNDFIFEGGKVWDRMKTPLAGVINGFSALILEVFGPDRGAHSRSAVGMAELPFGVAVEIEAEIEIR